MLTRGRKGCPKKEIVELEKLLASEFGENLSGDKITQKSIEELLKRGVFREEEEYRVIYEYLQDISDGDPFSDQTEKLESLLNTYQA